MAEEIQTYNQTEDVVVYRSEDNTVRLDVQLAEETVWLTQQQISALFRKAKSTISYHISNIFKEGELDEKVAVRKIRITTPHGAMSDRTQTDELNLYNLDVIISVGYRVHSVQGTRFRQWASGVLKDYLLKGYAVNPHIRYMEQRIDNKLQEHTEQIHELQNKVDFFVRTSLPPKEGIFVDGQIYDAYELIERLIKSAKKSILLIDNYVDESVLTMMSEKGSGVQVDIYTRDISKALRLAEDKFNAQYGGLTLHQTNNIHDRFLILDDQTIYLIGASLKDAGKKLFAFTEISGERIEELKKLL
ncbi:MAG: virulence RhuM family protein [Paludibacteraceae bacterium]|nr:virulence RhuM family protein [Paludibacteraceae bacterium]